MAPSGGGSSSERDRICLDPAQPSRPALRIDQTGMRLWSGTITAGQSRPQMCAGHEVSADGLTWTFTLRDGLTFHDGEPVQAKDCAMSVRRWSSRDSFGQPLLAATNDIETIDGVTRRTSREP